MTLSPTPDIGTIIEKHTPLLLEAVKTYIQSQNTIGSDDAPTIVPDQCFLSESEEGKAGFVFLHSTGLYAVEAVLTDDGQLQDIACHAL